MNFWISIDDFIASSPYTKKCPPEVGIPKAFF